MRALSGPVTMLLAAVAGAVYPLAFAPFGFYGLAPVCLGVLFFVWQRSSWKQAVAAGWVFGLASFAIGISWVYVSLHTFGNMPPALAVICVAVFGAIMALYPALAGGLQGVCVQCQPAIRWMLIMPILWVLGEWLRGVLLSGFPWLYLGYSQVGTFLDSLFPIVGTLGVSLWWALLVGAVLTLVFQRSAPRWVPGAAVALLLALVMLARVPQFVMPEGPPIRVAVIQNNIPLSDKWNARLALPIAERFQRQSVALTDVDLIVWPEVALPFYQDELPLDYLPILKAHSADFVIGLLDRDEARAGVPYYNVALGIGAEQTTYRKHQLVPFGEYLPLAFLLRWLLDYLRIPMSDFSAGALQQAAMPLAGTKVGASICYEDAFSDVIRRSASASHVLVNLSEDAWFGDSLAPHQRLQMARARVLETGRPMIRASNSGLSSIIRHDGTVTGQAGQFVEAVLRGRVQPTQGTTFFARAGNGPVIGLCLFGFLIGAPRAWIRRRGR
ncbi:MAG: apolipoprotein N-acyltransferase [Arenicellales bacterium]